MKLYKFQQEGVRWLASDGRVKLLADSPGVGKTPQALMALREVSARRTLIVVPNSVIGYWVDQTALWLPGWACAVVDGKTPSDVRPTILRDPYWRIVFINYEMMRALYAVAGEQRWSVIIFDEAHKLSARKSQTFKASRFLTRSKAAERVWYLTGTPLQNRVGEYWVFLRNTEVEFNSYWSYVYRYCNVSAVISPRTQLPIGQKVENPDPSDPRVADLVARAAPYILRRTKEEVYAQLPPKTYTRLPVEFDPTERALYDQMSETFRVVLPSGEEVTADTTIAQQTRLLQLCVDWRLLSAKPFVFAGPKKEALLDIVESLDGRSFVLFSQWSRVVYAVQRLLAVHKVTASAFTGDNTATREAELSRWRKSQTQALLVTIAAGGLGLDFTRADTCIFVDRSFNPAANSQATDRLHRKGQHNPVNVYDLYVRSTLEEHVHAVTDEKTLVADAIVQETSRR